jgi:SAM-dependent methyltransferase
MTNDDSIFDEYATYYDHALAQGLAATGEGREYFARRRIEWLRRSLDQLHFNAARTIDFGCGTGSNVPFLIELIGAISVVGIDASEKSLEIARSKFGSGQVQFLLPQEHKDDGQADLVFCNGVFHHVPFSNRMIAAEYLYRRLRPGGLFALWENNPWNPGTRYVMNRIPFDKDAVTLSPLEARRLVKAAGFEVIRTDFLFIFPRFLHWLRWSEPCFSRLPIGGQFELLCRKPSPQGGDNAIRHGVRDLQSPMLQVQEAEKEG